MLKKMAVTLDDFLYKKVIKNILKTSKLGYGFVVTGAEAGANFEHIYDNEAKGSLLIGKYIDRALLNLPAVQSTRGRKDDIKEILWNEIHNNYLIGRKTKVLDLASGGGRYIRELADENKKGLLEAVCLDKDPAAISLGETLLKKDGISNIRFLKADIFKTRHLRVFSKHQNWIPNVIIASGFFIYLNNETVEKTVREIYDLMPTNGILIFSSYESLNTRKLMRKSMKTSSGKEWILYYRKPDYWRDLLLRTGFNNIYITRDRWKMNNICWARKK